MSDYYIGELRWFAFNKIPDGWHVCDGTKLPIKNNAALFALLGTAYGGDGKVDFALPDLRDKTPVGRLAPGTFATFGATVGSSTVTLTAKQLPPHTHSIIGSTALGSATPQPKDNYFGVDQAAAPTMPINIYATVPTTATEWTPLHSETLSDAGSGASHENRQPFVKLNACIALTGLFPPRA